MSSKALARGDEARDNASVLGLKKLFGGADEPSPTVQPEAPRRALPPGPVAQQGQLSGATRLAGQGQVAASMSQTMQGATTFAADTEIDGDVVTASPMMIQGVIAGNVHSGAHVLLGADGNVSGDVSGSDVEVRGFVEGNVVATGKLVITSTGTIQGNISSRGLRIDEGGRLEGRCSMGEEITHPRIDPQSLPAPPLGLSPSEGR